MYKYELMLLDDITVMTGRKEMVSSFGTVSIKELLQVDSLRLCCRVQYRGAEASL